MGQFLCKVCITFGAGQCQDGKGHQTEDQEDDKERRGADIKKGAGAFSDGKYNITNDFGGTLYEHIGKKQAIELMKYVDEINMEHGGEGTRLFSTAGTKFKKICMQNKLKLLDASVRHLGTDIN